VPDRILLIDDDTDALRAMGDYFDGIGYEVGAPRPPRRVFRRSTVYAPMSCFSICSSHPPAG